MKVTVASEGKTVVVATDKNAPEDQILDFVVSHKEGVSTVELEVRDVRVGDLQVWGIVPEPLPVLAKCPDHCNKMWSCSFA